MRFPVHRNNGFLYSGRAVSLTPDCGVMEPGIFTMDTHFENYMDTQEGKYLPVPHCIKGSDGWKIRPEIADLLSGAKIYEKPTFGSTALAVDLKALSEKKKIELELIGLCTDICVVSNALLLKACMPEVKFPWMPPAVPA